MDCVACLSSYLKHLSGHYDFGCVFMVFGSFKQSFELLLTFLLFGFGLKVLNFNWFCKPMNQLLCDSGGESGNGMSATRDFVGKRSSKDYSCPPITGKLQDIDTKSGVVEELNDDDEYRNKQYDEDNEFDVLVLRKWIKMERHRANSALLELKKERMSAAVAAEESMAMILRLQNEKSLIEMESKQYKRLSEEKLNHDQEQIQSLLWLVMKYESDRNSLEEQLEFSHKKLRLFMNSELIMDNLIEEDEAEEYFITPNTNVEDGSEIRLFRSLDLVVSP